MNNITQESLNDILNMSDEEYFKLIDESPDDIFPWVLYLGLIETKELI